MTTEIIVIEKEDLVKPAVLTGEWCGPVRLSNKQPEYVGFGYVIHVPMFAYVAANAEIVNKLLKRSMKMEKRNPVFMRTEREFARLTFCYGDKRTATMAYDLFKNMTRTLYKNWL